MKKHILVIDKDQLILYALSKALKDDGCEVKTAETSVDAIEKLSHCPYDLCLLDAQFLKADGTGLNKIINDISPETQVILMAGEPFASDEDGYLQTDAPVAGSLPTIRKPFALSDLTEVVRQTLKGGEEDSGEDNFIRTDSEERSRKNERRPWREEIDFGMSVIHEGVYTRLSMMAQTVDISDSGVGLLTSYPLRESQIIGFEEKLHNRVGVVAWSRMIDRESFRVGVRFA